MIEWNCPCGNSYKFHGFTQPEQKPVGFYDARGNDICIEIPMGESRDWWQPVYTTPPQRKPLTDEQIEAIAEEFCVGGWICDFARAIEAAHGIKE